MRILTSAELGLYAQDRRRRVLRLSQDELAKRIGVSRYWVMDFEAGRPGSEIGLVLRAFDVLGIHLHALPAGSEPRERPGGRRARTSGPHSGPVIDLAEIVDADVAALPSGAVPPKSNASRTSSGTTARRAPRAKEKSRPRSSKRRDE